MPQPLSDLIEPCDPAWPRVQEWLSTATNQLEVLPTDRARGERTSSGIQVTTRSPLGAIALESGGILVDHGWLRLLGAGSARMTAGLLDWNGLGKGAGPDPPLLDAIVVAHDAVGGFFAINGGAFAGGKRGRVFYFSPDSLRWEDLGMGYSGLVQWAIMGDMGLFYQDSRWLHWKDEIVGVSGDQGISIYPFLFSAGPPVIDRSRRLVPMTELWALQWHLANQARDVADGALLTVRITE